MRKGDHTCKITIAYHRCPDCGQIIESRKSWFYRMGAYLKEEQCPRCHKEIMIEKAKPPPIGPLLGEPPAPEVEWR